MLFKKYKDSSTLPDRHSGGESIFVAILTCIIISVMGVSLTRLHNASFMSLVSSETSMQAQHFAKAKMDYLIFRGYNNLAVQAKTKIDNSDFKDAVTLGTVSTDSSGVSKRTVTVSVYNGDEASPRATLQHVFYSNDADLYVRNGNSTANSISMHYDSSNDRLYAKVDGNEKNLGGGGVPTGTIVMWSGTTIPDGWALCNGSNGTPDLRDRFIVGAGLSYGLGSVGGSDVVTLTLAQIPSHNHTMWLGRDWAQGYNATGFKYGESGISNAIHEATHHLVTEYSGGSQAHENRPPYYALYYIIKL